MASLELPQPATLQEEETVEMDAITPSLDSPFSQDFQEMMAVERVTIDTLYGPLHITVQGDKHKPAIVTCHDLGLNHSSTFGTFLADPAMVALSEAFCWYHIDTPGQETCADKLPGDYQFPSMTQLSEQVDCMADYFELHSIIGLGVGSGADILARYATLCPARVRGLVLVNCCLQAPGWSPAWLLGKMAVWQLQGREDGFSQLSLTYLMRHALGPVSGSVGREAEAVFRETLSCQNPQNLGLLLHSYLTRSTIAQEFTRAINCECLFITSDNYQHKKEMVKLVSLQDVRKTTWLEVPQTSGLLLSEEPEKMATALRCFLQGLSLVPTHSSPLLFTHPTPPHALLSPCLTLRGHTVPLHAAV